jgi:phosphoenolpyruvate-protein kinase (PTS system EI component)
MAEFQDVSYELALKLRDLEESQKLSKERLLLIGQNLIEAQEKNISEILELKKQNQNLNDDVKRMKSLLNSLSEEVSKSARKEELAILERQWKMFDPLEFVRMDDLEDAIEGKLPTHHHQEEQKNFWSGKL